MYFNTSDISWVFSRGTWIFLLIVFLLAAWKVIDIFVWLFSHINITIV